MKAIKLLAIRSEIQIVALTLLGVAMLIQQPSRALDVDTKKLDSSGCTFLGQPEHLPANANVLNRILSSCYKFKPANEFQRYNRSTIISLAHGELIPKVYKSLSHFCFHLRAASKHATIAQRDNRFHDHYRNYFLHFRNAAYFLSPDCGGFNFSNLIPSFEGMRRFAPLVIKAFPHQESRIRSQLDLISRGISYYQNLQSQPSLPVVPANGAYGSGENWHQRMMREQQEKERVIKMFEDIHEQDRFGRPYP